MIKKLCAIFLTATLLISCISLSVYALYDNTIIYGDINNNGKVDTGDAQRALLAAAQINSLKDEGEKRRADIDNDGAVTIYDARQILRSAAGIISLKPTGAFEGFQGFTTATGGLKTPSEAVVTFNALLNRIKSVKPGFTKTEKNEVVDFNIENVNLIGQPVGQSAQTVAALIKGMLQKEMKNPEPQILFKDQNCDNNVSAETRTYVSNLDYTANDIYGIKCSVDEASGYMTISIALPDAELDNINKTAFNDVFNDQILKENSQNLMEKIFGKGTYGEAPTKLLKNCVLTAVIDSSTSNIISYTTTYETYMRIEKTNIDINLISADLFGVTYGTRVTVVYDNFQW